MLASFVMAIALLAVSVPPGPAQAAISLTFRNDCNVAVVVQTGTIQRGKVLNDQPLVLRVGTSGRVPFHGDKLLLIYEGKSNRILHQSALRFQGSAASFSIQSDPQKSGKVKLVPLRGVGPAGP
jgi:hypothetical protein